MGKMISRRRSFTRESGFRDASLIVIACEGNVTEVTYFDAFKKRYAAPPSRIHVEILQRTDASRSAPEYVLQSADRKKKALGMLPGDEFWILIDYDRWGQQKIAWIAQQVSQKGYRLALSNPCFEAWLLLHWTEDILAPEELQRLCDEGCKGVVGKIREIRGHYNKELNDVSEYLDRVEKAIAYARALDVNPADRWPSSFGSRVYLLCERIIKKDNEVTKAL